ncbi:unnamed protein product, partial [Allacma fusca]
VIEKFPGRDGVRRLVKLKTAHGEHLLPIQRVYPLEIESRPADRKSEEVDGNSTHTEASDAVKPEVEEEKPEVKEEKKPARRTRSGRVIRAPERLTYTLAGLDFA